MPFNTALSGIRSASSDLSITGHNIANASTTGFKSSRGEFGDLYATSVLGSGSNQIGNGVRLQNVAQQFSQGSTNFTENDLDLSISGNGFFVVQQNGEQMYTRAGTFGRDDRGYVVNNTGARLQGFPADDLGNISGLQGDVRIHTGNQAPRGTTRVESLLNLDATAPILQSTGRSFSTEGNAVGVTRVGLESNTTTQLTADSFTFPLPLDFSTGTVAFDVELTAGSGNNGTVPIQLNTASGVPATITTFNDLRTLAGAINAQLFAPEPPATPIDVVASAVDAGGGNFRLEFTALQSGESSQIRLLNGSGDTDALGLTMNTPSVPGEAAANNNYPAQSIDIVGPDGNVVRYTSDAAASAARVASELNAMTGVSASANTSLRFLASQYTNANGNLQVKINGVNIEAPTLQALGNQINTFSNTVLPGITATLDLDNGDLVLNSAVGDDMKVAISSVDDGDSLGVLGNPAAPPEILEVDLNGVLNNASAIAADGNTVVVGGSIDIVLSEGYTAQNANPPSIGLFGPLTNTAFTNVTLNAFDPTDQNTYNSATSLPIYDSLGNSHVMTQYFVKQPYDPNDPTTAPNEWTMYVQIDGHDVGDPDTNLPPPQNTLPTMASYNLRFNEDGSLNRNYSDNILVSNWVPRDSDGNSNGALGPQNVLAGGTTNIPAVPVTSNFVIDFAGTTQFGSDFSVNDNSQNGYATGRLSRINIDDNGVIFAQFTNGESKILGQLALADFKNAQGLQPVGDTMWAENFESGPPNIGVPGSAALGMIQAGALEESNVDLSEELVRLIIAQRNFQANAKTIESADQITQTIINIR